MSEELVRATAEAVRSTTPERRFPNIDAYETDLERRGRLTSAVRESLDKARAIRHDYGTVFYIAGALTGMPDNVKERYAAFSAVLTRHGSSPASSSFGYAPHLHGTDPIKHPAVTPNEVRDIDYLWSAVIADAHFNFWDPIAHGNGIEEGWAEENTIPSIYLVPKDMSLSRLPRGMWNIAGVISYDDPETDGLPIARKLINELQGNPQTLPAGDQ